MWCFIYTQQIIAVLVVFFILLSLVPSTHLQAHYFVMLAVVNCNLPVSDLNCSHNKHLWKFLNVTFLFTVFGCDVSYGLCRFPHLASTVLVERKSSQPFRMYWWCSIITINRWALVVNPRCACEVRVTVVGFVCLGVCLLLVISLLECSFVSQRIAPNQRTMKVRNYVRLSQKLLHCKARARKSQYANTQRTG